MQFVPPPDVDTALMQQLGTLNVSAVERRRVELAAAVITNLNDAVLEYDIATTHTRCPTCPRDCIDDRPECPKWASHGECFANRGFMDAII
jgi:hypothetical protein